MAKHRGWKAIADAAECSVRTAQELAQPRDNGRLPLPLERDHVGVFVDSARIEQWKRMECEPYLKYLARVTAERAMRLVDLEPREVA